MDDVIVRREFDWSETPPSIAIVTVIADIENVDPIDLPTTAGTTLYSYVDPGALDALVDGERVAVSFSMAEYRIRIDGAELTVAAE
ncbi:HalOD1 output domain-containing protein [Natrinema thermotolerans]